MLKSVEGIYQNGTVELLEQPEEQEATRVIVTFLPRESGVPGMPPLTAAEIAELRWRLASFEEDWNAPGMEVYDVSAAT